MNKHVTATHVTAMHARDALIEFDAGPHKYTCAGEGNYLSVTSWLHSHFPAFDADAIIGKMNLTNPKCKYYGQTPEQIKAGWDKGRDEAAALGTEMHKAIEEFWLGGCPPGPPDLGQVETEGWTQEADAQSGYTAIETPVLGQVETEGNNLPAKGGLSSHFISFLKDNPNLRCYRTEWMIFDEDVRLAGSIDFVAENEDGTLTIYDWKRCKDIKKTNSFGGSALAECISHLPDTNYWHYALQLNTYKTILERKYGKTVKAMFLVGLHPALPRYQLLKVPELRTEMAELFALRVERLLPEGIH